MKKNSILPVILALAIGLSCNSFSSQEEVNTTTTEVPSEISDTSTNKPEKTQEKDLLSLASGAYLLKHPLSFGFWSVKLIDGTKDFWISPGGHGKDQVFIIGLPAETTFKSFAFVKGDDYYGEGSSAKDVLVEVSNTDWKTGYQKVLETSLPIDVEADQKFPVTAEVPARFVRLTVKNAHKNPENVSLAEFLGFGDQKQEDSLTGLTGTYHAIGQKGDLNQPASDSDGEYAVLTDDEANNFTPTYNDIFLKQDGTRILGCYTGEADDRFDGGIEGNVAQTNWEPATKEPPTKGVMSFSTDGKLLYYTELNDEMQFSSYTVYQRVSNNVGNCTGIKGFSDKNAGSSQLAEDLEKDGRATVYGINFDFNSDKIKDESRQILDQIATVLKENSGWKMTIEGHTDNVGGESFNQTLSEKRANSVKRYLVESGIDESRLSAKGLGMSSPTATNETESGRARNRRVELVKQ